MTTSLTRVAAAVILPLGAATLAACNADVPTGSDPSASPAVMSASVRGAPFGGRIAVCHAPSARSARIVEVAAPALPAHLAHGDYIATLLVSHAPDAAEDGAHFRRIGDALAAARAGRLARGELTSAPCRITIVVSADTYHGTATGAATGDVEHFPLIVDVPDITLHGALLMGLDGQARATGVALWDRVTTLRPDEPLPVVALSSTPLIIANHHPNGPAGDGLRVEGFAFESGHDATVDAGGQGLLSVRAERLVVRGNRFGTGFTESLDIRAGSAEVAFNYLGGIAGFGTCDVCLSGPGHFSAYGNRLLAGGIPGIGASGVVSLPVPVGVEPVAIPAEAVTRAWIFNNYVSDHQSVPVGTGIRVDAIGIGAPNVHNSIYATIWGNQVTNNRFGMIVHAAFPVAGTDRKSDVDVRLAHNVFETSCEAKLLVSLSRHQTALGLKVFPYLLNSTFTLSLGGNLPWDEVWYGHEAGYGNTLVVDGQTIPNGGRQFYSATSCPGL